MTRLGAQGDRATVIDQVPSEFVKEVEVHKALTPDQAADAIARAWPDAHEALLARTYGPPGLEDDIAFCAQVSVLDVVPRLNRMVDGAAEMLA